MSSQGPLVTAIVAVLNGERYLADALDSIVAQTYERVEILVVDGPSSDRTEAIARSYQQVRYLRQAGSGLADAWNTGLAAATGEFIAFLDHDDYWTPDKLERQVRHLVTHPDVHLAIAHFRFVLAHPTEPIPASLRPELLERTLVGRIPGTLVARRAVFEAVGFFDVGLSIASDVDWFSRAKDQRLSIALMPDMLLYKRVGRDNLSGNARVNNRELLRLLKRSIDRQRSDEVHRR